MILISVWNIPFVAAPRASIARPASCPDLREHVIGQVAWDEEAGLAKWLRQWHAPGLGEVRYVTVLNKGFHRNVVGVGARLGCPAVGEEFLDDDVGQFVVGRRCEVFEPVQETGRISREVRLTATCACLRLNDHWEAGRAGDLPFHLYIATRRDRPEFRHWDTRGGKSLALRHLVRQPQCHLGTVERETRGARNQRRENKLGIYERDNAGGTMGFKKRGDLSWFEIGDIEHCAKPREHPHIRFDVVVNCVDQPQHLADAGRLLDQPKRSGSSRIKHDRKLGDFGTRAQCRRESSLNRHNDSSAGKARGRTSLLACTAAWRQSLARWASRKSSHSSLTWTLPTTPAGNHDRPA